MNILFTSFRPIRLGLLWMTREPQHLRMGDILAYAIQVGLVSFTSVWSSGQYTSCRTRFGEAFTSSRDVGGHIDQPPIPEKSQLGQRRSRISRSPSRQPLPDVRRQPVLHSRLVCWKGKLTFTNGSTYSGSWDKDTRRGQGMQ